MFAQITKILLCLVLCLGLLSCPSQICRSYQDVAKVALPLVADIDSVAMIVNDSIVGCGNLTRKAVGSKTHRIRFPINVRLQFFSQEDLQKELFFKMDKNTVAYIYIGNDCSNSLIDLSFTDDYCWSIEKMGDNSTNDDIRCTEYSVDGKRELCEMWFLQ